MNNNNVKHDVACTDHLGNCYPNIKSMCNRWGINPETYSRRIRVYGMSAEEALVLPVKHNGGLRCADHLGNKYRSHTKMCKHWGVDRKVFEYRIQNGWGLEGALTGVKKQE